jgi:hypothetical protein
VPSVTPDHEEAPIGAERRTGGPRRALAGYRRNGEAFAAAIGELELCLAMAAAAAAACLRRALGAL